MSTSRSPVIPVAVSALLLLGGLAAWQLLPAEEAPTAPDASEAASAPAPVVTRTGGPDAGAATSDAPPKAAADETPGKGAPPAQMPGPPPPEVQKAMRDQARQDAYDGIPAQAEAFIARIDAAAPLDDARHEELLSLLIGEYEEVFLLTTEPPADGTPVKDAVRELRTDTDAAAAELLDEAQLAAWQEERREPAGKRR